MDVRLLGPIEARRDDELIELGARKQRAMLAMLALQVGRTVSADHLAEGLWGDEPPASAHKMVQLYVSHLRRLLAGNGAAIVTHGRGYELQLADGDVDAIRFERLVGEGRPREALALWCGEPLCDVADEPFAAPEIRRLDELRLRAAEAAIDTDLAAGRHTEVLGELEALVAQEPLREHLHAQRMLALYRSGRQSESLDAYRRARAALVEEIGVEPGGELRRLHESVLSQDPALDGPVVASQPPRRKIRPPRPPPDRPAPRRRSRLALAGAALLVLAGVLAFAVSRAIEPDGLPGVHENAVGVIDPGDGRIKTQYAVGRGPGAVVSGGGSVWIANALDGTVTRIDRGRQLTQIDVGGAPIGLAFGGGALWVADGEGRSIVQVDPGANKVVQRIDVGNAPLGVAVAAGALWVASGVDGTVRRHDLDRPAQSRSIPIGSIPSAVAAGAGALWVASEEAGTVTRVDPRSGQVVEPINVGNGPSALAVGAGAVWVVDRHHGTLSRIDPERNAVSWTRSVGRDPTAVAAGAGAVWVAGGESGTVLRVDPDGSGVVARVPAGSSPVAIALSGGSVWATAVASEATHRGGTLRAVLSADGPDAVPIDWLHSNSYIWQTPVVTSLVYDGLVAHRRVDGSAAATVVGALATRVPSPSEGGRRYVFTLRRGVRYSDGRLVRPQDFRASIERYLRVAGERFPLLLEGIVGARRCSLRPSRCDLSQGIETDARTGTITIRLERADSEFLHKLTLPFAYVVPADTPVRATTDRAPPGTGPYRVASWDADRGGRLVRNPRFDARLRAERPAGFPDRIDISVRPRGTTERQIQEVQRDDADVAILANPFAADVSADRLAALVARAPGRVHSNPMPVTDWMFLNVRERPFDDARVRRAVNLAADRASIAALEGGPEMGVPICQVVPMGFPAHEPRCPYTADPTPGRGWVAPDSELARRLMTASGRRGERVVVTVPPFRRVTGRYFETLLDGLGLRASLRVLGDDRYWETIYDPDARTQMGFVGWAADYVGPSTFVESNFACAPGGDPVTLNASRLCDPVLTGLLARARGASRVDAAAAWAAAGRRVTDLAPVVPMTNRRAVLLVSKRVGNVKTHPQWFLLLDQLWVR